MATCAYLVQNGASLLLAGKCKLPNVKNRPTVPKMEYHALTMATRLAHSIVNALQRRTTISTVYILTDSEIALCWVKNTIKENSAGVYVNNRRREIHQIVKNLPDNVKFGYVSTSMNPADCATRGLQKDELSQHIWWYGPEFITKKTEEWEEECKVFSLQHEDHCFIALTRDSRLQPSDLIDRKRYKCLSSCQTSIAYVLRFISGVISRVNVDLRTIEQHIPEIPHMTTNTYVTAEERKMALRVMTKNHQQVYLSDLRKKNLKHLKLRLDDNAILRCRGRLEKTNLAYDAQERWEDSPILRPIDFIQRDMVVTYPLEYIREDEEEEEYLPQEEIVSSALADKQRKLCRTVTNTLSDSGKYGAENISQVYENDIRSV
ncbi:unnamed protein product [Heligmosomoides polygyrus]|uniref:RNase H domain-containing protein n=1 Tax=Heligmosomoides polygyrus TaxID=6339 RepID=A0A183GNC4_HELPZ|nr:unnamed protein product [Heligmosomoides polygyrus]